MAATTISRANIGTNDDGSGTTGTVVNVAYVNLIYDNIDALFTSTTGIRLNQAGGDNSIVSLESSDVAHGMTSIENTDVYGTLGKVGANDGGLRIQGFTEVTQGVLINGYQTTSDTAKTTAGIGAIVINGALKSGTGVTVIGANGAIVTMANNGSTKFIFDAEGDSHEDGTGWTAYDAYDDVALIASIEGELAGDQLRDEFKRWMTYNRADLERARLVTFNEDGHHFVNRSRMQMALCGAIRQLARMLSLQDARLLALEGPAGDGR